jgi:alpha-2-macroglobulin
VHLKIRTTGNASVADLAIVDLLPGGFDPVDAPPPSSDADDASESANHAPSVSAAPQSTWYPEHTDQREDRMVLYGVATPDAKEFVYRIRATNAGRFVVPPAYGESMYDRRIKAQSAGGGTLTVQPARRAGS